VDVATVSNCVDEIVKAKLQEDGEEEKEIENRKTSVIIHGLTEPQGQTADERIQALFHNKKCVLWNMVSAP